MDDTITTIYCLCDECLKAIGHRDDPQARLTTAEVMTVALVAAAFFGGNVEQARRFLSEYGYVPAQISKGRFNRRLHAIEPELWRGLFSVLAGVFKGRNVQGTYAVDSLPVAACDNIRIRRCRLYPPEEHGAGAFRGYIASKRRYFYGLRVHLVVTQAGEPVRQYIETVFGGLSGLFSKKIHAVTPRGFELKIVWFLLAFSIQCL